MRAFLASFRDARRDHPWMVPGLLLSASAALGTALPDILSVLR